MNHNPELMTGRVLWVGGLRSLRIGVEVMAKKFRMHLTGDGLEKLKGLLSSERTAVYWRTHPCSHEGRLCCSVMRTKSAAP